MACGDWPLATTRMEARLAHTVRMLSAPTPSSSSSSSSTSTSGTATARFELRPGDACAVGGTVAAAEEVGADANAVAALQDAMAERVASGVLPMLGLTVVKDGRTVLCAGAGVPRPVDGAVPLDSRSILRFFSMTKAVTTLAVMQLVEAGKLALDDLVSARLPPGAWNDGEITVLDAATPAARPITLRDLCCHTSGLTYGFMATDPAAEAVSAEYRARRLELPFPITEHADAEGEFCESLLDFARRLGRIPLTSSPGTRFEYSVSTDLLGAVLEHVTGEALEVLFRKAVFEPLGMVDTSFSIPEEKLDRFSQCYRSVDVGEYTLADFGDGTDTAHDNGVGSCGAETPYLRGAGRAQEGAPSGGGGLLSTLDDYSRFASCLMNGGELDGVRIIKAETIAECMKDQLAPMGAERAGIMLAWQGFGLLGGVVSDPGADGAYLPAGSAAGGGTFGWGGAAGTWFFVDPVNKLNAVMTTQLLGYSVGDPTLRAEMGRAVYGLFPELRERLPVLDDDPEEGFGPTAGFTG